jgi:hypothetical protein
LLELCYEHVSDVDKPRKFVYIMPPEAWGAIVRLKSRKRRPQERWRKKREKGKRKPSELFFLKDLEATGDFA